MAVLNSTILEKAWLSGSNDYQQRIPNPSINGYAAHVAALFDPMNNDLFNQFSGMLVGLMGTYVESKLFENPLRELKKPAKSWGNSERTVAVRYLQSHTYKVDSECLLKLEKPEFREWFYSVNEPRRYEFSWSKYELQRVFAEEGYGYDDLLAATISQMYSSDNYDEMNLMIHAFAEAEQRMGGIFNVQLSAVPSDEATSKELLADVRAIANRMRFPSTLYNHIDIPVFESPETLIFWVTPEADAYIDVMALAAAFNMDKANVQYRKIVIPEFPIPNVVAALTSEDFIYCRDVYYGIEPPFYNPENMTYKYYLQHAQMIGVNPCANAVLFSTNAGTNVNTVVVTVSGITLTPAAATVEPGGKVKLDVDLTGSVANDAEAKIGVEPDAALFTLSAVDSNNTAFDLNSRTYVDAQGYLHVQKQIESGSVITVTVESAYTDPSSSYPTTTYTDTATVTVS